MAPMVSHKRKRGRPSRAAVEEQRAAAAAAHEEVGGPRKSTRRGEAGEEEENDDTSLREPRSARLRDMAEAGNTRRTSKELATTESTKEPEIRKKRRRAKTTNSPKPINEGNEHFDTPEAETKRRRGRPRKQPADDTPVESTPRRKAPLPKAARNKVKAVEAEAEAEAEPEEEPEEDDEPSETETKLPYQQLVARTRLIPLATMTSKWAPLEPEAIAAVQAILADCARPVLSHTSLTRGPNNERRQQQSQLAISAATRRLRSKLIKGIPFPPAAGSLGRPTRMSRRNGGGGSTREPEFDYERTQECVRALEQQLDPLQHAVALLERQRKQEEHTLEEDYAALRQLETNAQAEMRTWRDRTRRLHVLAPVEDTTRPSGNLPSSLELTKSTDVSGDSDNYQDADKELSTLSTQLGNHMESLRSNLQQIQGVVPAIDQSKAVLQQVLRKYLDARQLEHIVLGD